ncbi:anoctamin-8 isoform X2 [Silurus asotus]|uniref:Anoctamin n=1 Tax=Silurus asotus TaxID=30991 RepID=A0AAD5AEM0_SILAS|nr:anoctamin-8 isoform X2 [Silurus asotus]
MPDAASAGNGADPDASRHRHRAPAETEKPEQSASCQQTSSGVLVARMRERRRLRAWKVIRRIACQHDAKSSVVIEKKRRQSSRAAGHETALILRSAISFDTTDDHTLLWLLNHIRLGIPELIIQIRHHKHTQVYAFFVTATYENLLRGAEEMGLRKPVKPEFGGGSRSFSCEEDYIYENIESELCFFTSQERQNIIKYWLDNLRAKPGEVLHNIHFLEGQPIIPELMARGVIQQVFPLHEQRILGQLMKSWVQAVCEKQPLDDICDYFGVKIAMYFAWLGFYTTSMLYPAVIGFVLWMLTETDQTSRDICCVVFALFNVVWATLFLERWKRRGAELAYKWGTLDTPAESLEEPRPQFRGVKRCSPVTGCEEFYYPPWRRRVFRWLVSFPVCIFCLCFVFLAMLICFELQEFVMGIKELPRVVRFIPEILLAITVTACDEVYRKIACWLNDMENYRLQSAYEKNLIIKMVLVSSLFLCNVKQKPISIRQDENLNCCIWMCLLNRMCVYKCVCTLLPRLPSDPGLTLLTLRIKKIGLKDAGQCIEPHVTISVRDLDGVDLNPVQDTPVSKHVKRTRTFISMSTWKSRNISRSYQKDTFQDYQEMFIQFGYVVLFSSAFPLAAMCALINNIIEIRSDAFKLCTGLQRPFGMRVESIGQWQTLMEAMGLIAIIVNCYLIGQCGQLQRLFPWLSPEMAIISIVILEHFAVLLKYVIHVAIPDIPSWVSEEMAKLEFQRREAFKKHERQAQQHFQQQQRRKREEEERQRQAEYQARRERDDGRSDASGGDHHHEKSQGSKSRSGGGGGGSVSDKPKRPSSLLANNNVMKFKQIIPLQSKFSSGTARSPQSPTGNEPKLPGFLSFKFLKSPENKKEAAAASASASASMATLSQEKSQSPSKSFNPGKLFNFGKSDGGACMNGAQQTKPGEGVQPAEKPVTKSDLNDVPDEIPSPGEEEQENGHSLDSESSGPKI